MGCCCIKGWNRCFIIRNYIKSTSFSNYLRHFASNQTLRFISEATNNVELIPTIKHKLLNPFSPCSMRLYTVTPGQVACILCVPSEKLSFLISWFCSISHHSIQCFHGCNSHLFLVSKKGWRGIHNMVHKFSLCPEHMNMISYEHDVLLNPQ